MIVAGFFPLVWLGLENVGGWSGLKNASVPTEFVHSWTGLDSPANNPMGVEWFGMAMGLGFVLSFGYWCTDFLVVQRAMAADSMSAARRTPLIAAVPKMFFPFLVILPRHHRHRRASSDAGARCDAAAAAAPADGAVTGKGLIPVKIDEKTGEPKLNKDGKPELDYDLAIPAC